MKNLMEHLRNRKRTALAVGFLTLLALGWWAFRPDPGLAKVKALQKQLTGGAGRRLTQEQRRDLWGQFRQTVAKLKPEQRRALANGQRNNFREQPSKYFALPKAQRAAYLDEQINRMDAQRKERARAAAGQAAAGRMGQPAGQNGPAAAPPARGAAGRFVTADDRERRRRERLDQTTPQDRAMRSQYFQDLQARRQQRGLPTLGFGGRFGG